MPSLEVASSSADSNSILSTKFTELKMMSDSSSDGRSHMANVKVQIEIQVIKINANLIDAYLQYFKK
jgi:hypothetical protein